jgi:proteasome lid subunit RPN8/RPN11
VEISRELLDEVVAHAIADAPNECCGVIGARSGDVLQAVVVHPATNTAASPLRFEIDALEVLSVNNKLEDDGLQVGAIYHSHTRTAPYPSQTDINFAAHWPGVEWLIVGLGGEQPEVRSYLIDGGRVTEVALTGPGLDVAAVAGPPPDAPAR